MAATEPPLHRVVALALPDVLLLDLAAPTHLFGHCGGGRYRFDITAAEPGRVRTTTGTDLYIETGLEALELADTVVVPGHLAWEAPPSAEVLGALRAAAARGARVMSICTGAFTLGFAGLLDGRRATTHWHQCSAMAELFPEPSTSRCSTSTKVRCSRAPASPPASISACT